MKSMKNDLEGFRFEVSKHKSDYEVEWLDRPDEGYPSGYSALYANRSDGKSPPRPDAEIVADIRDWLLEELRERNFPTQ